VIYLEADINYFTKQQENFERRLHLSLLCLLDHCLLLMCPSSLKLKPLGKKLIIENELCHVLKYNAILNF
jgi:hypothetical protein